MRNDLISRYASGETLYMEERCFVTDFTPPDHCANSTSCNYDVLNFGNRIRRDLNLTIAFDGWFDPEPDSKIAGSSGKLQ